MKILNVNSTLSLRYGGGTAERTFEMSRHLSMIKDVICTSLTLDIGLDNDRIFAQLPASLIAIPTLSKRFHLPLGGWKVIRKLVIESDVIHMMNHWSMLNVLVYLAARIYRKPYVICPAGSLLVFGRSKILKFLFSKIIGNKIIKNACGYIAITEVEFLYFKDYGVDPSKITLIPNGVNKQDFPKPKINSFKVKFNLENKKIILFVGRLNLIKGPDLLLKAFSKIHNKLDGYDLVYIGPDEGMVKELKKLVKFFSIEKKVHLLGFLSGQDKVNAYRASEILVVPSRSDAMSIVAIEAGICGTLAILTDRCGFSTINDVSPDLEVTFDEDILALNILKILKNPTKKKILEKKYYNFVAKNYSWDTIVAKHLRLYKTIIETSR